MGFTLTRSLPSVPRPRPIARCWKFVVIWGPRSYLHWSRSWVAAGASIVGGCCGIGPEHIAQLHLHLLPHTEVVEHE
nr:homocysteine S-methyltransferase family protein [Pseudomonas gregormendelii]